MERDFDGFGTLHGGVVHGRSGSAFVPLDFDDLDDVVAQYLAVVVYETKDARGALLGEDDVLPWMVDSDIDILCVTGRVVFCFKKAEGGNLLFFWGKDEDVWHCLAGRDQSSHE